MSSVVGPLVTLLCLLLLLRLIVKGRLTAFSPTRARTNMRSLKSPNTLVVLSGINLAALAYQSAQIGAAADGIDTTLVAKVIVGFVVLAVVLLVVSRSWADSLLGVAGIIAAFVTIYMADGAAGTMAVLVLALMVLFLISVIRGFVRPG